MSGGIDGLRFTGSGGSDHDRTRSDADGNHNSWRSIRRPPAFGVVIAVLSFLSAFYHILDVVGGAELLIFEVLVTMVLATWFAGFLRERTAIGLSALGFAVALLAYVSSVPQSARALFTVSRVVADVLALFTGLSVLRLLNVGAWALLLAPVPTFLAWYLAARERYVWAVAVAAVTTGFFVLTGDAGPAAAISCAIGATIAVAFAGLATAGRRGMLAQLDTVTIIVVAMVVVPSAVTVVPGSASNPVLPGGGTPSVESSLVANSERVAVLGSIRLSPEVRFVVTANRSEYWRVGSYDRYTGQGWVRTGDSNPYRGSLAGPPGDSVPITQRVTVRSTLDAMPAAWRPVSVGGPHADTTQVTDHEGLRPGTALLENDSYVVRSEVPEATSGELRRAGTDYPDSVASRYTQLPESTPDRVDERTREVLGRANANNPYDAAVAIERYLESSKTYSLDVPPPNGDVADQFLFEMEEGYCVYYATTMVVMLRSQGIPARFVTGYTPGQRVAEDEWVVRGLDSHAWVEVYFPEHGWIKFDPTPSSPRESAESRRVDSARASGAENVDAGGSEDGTYTTPTSTETSTGGLNRAAGRPDSGERRAPDSGIANGTFRSTLDGRQVGAQSATATGTAVNASDTDWSPTRRETVFGVALLLGFVAGARRVGLTRRAYRGLWLLYQPRRDPDTDAIRAFRRLEHLGARAYRPRRPGETPRAYLDVLATHAFDGRVQTVGRAYERARYGPGASEAEATDAVGTTDAFVRRQLPVLRRFLS